jgi:hypothetical protein
MPVENSVTGWATGVFVFPLLLANSGFFAELGSDFFLLTPLELGFASIGHALPFFTLLQCLFCLKLSLPSCAPGLCRANDHTKCAEILNSGGERGIRTPDTAFDRITV